MMRADPDDSVFNIDLSLALDRYFGLPDGFWWLNQAYLAIASNEKHSEEFPRMANVAKQRVRQLAPDEAMKRVESGALMLVVREKDEFTQDYLARAAHLSRGVLEMKIHEIAPDKSQPIVCYCSGCNRGALAADTLQQMGYTNVFAIEGGMRAVRASDAQPASENSTQEPS